MYPLDHSLLLLVAFGERRGKDTLVVVHCLHSTIRGPTRAHMLMIQTREVA
jgi:hypothetical protein